MSTTVLTAASARLVPYLVSSKYFRTQLILFNSLTRSRESRTGGHGAHQAGGQEGVVIEPHTGLPMNVGKYGTGAGGTDGNETIHGLHSHGAGNETSSANVATQGSTQGGNAGTDWEGIKKANTPY